MKTIPYTLEALFQGAGQVCAAAHAVQIRQIIKRTQAKRVPSPRQFGEDSRTRRRSSTIGIGSPEGGQGCGEKSGYGSPMPLHVRKEAKLAHEKKKRWG